jgi:hypothetical protein
MKRLTGLGMAVLIAFTTLSSCGSPTSPSSSCPSGPYAFDSNVNRCRAANGQFAPNACCGR